MKCRVCKCTEERACANSCGWAHGEGALCTNCASVVEAIRAYREVAYEFNLTALLMELNKAARPARLMMKGKPEKKVRHARP